MQSEGELSSRRETAKRPCLALTPAKHWERRHPQVRRAPPRRSSGAAGGKTLTVGCSPTPPARSLGPRPGRKGRVGASGLAGDAAASEPALGLSEAARGGSGREGEVVGARGAPIPGEGPVRAQPSARGKRRRADRLPPGSAAGPHVRAGTSRAPRLRAPPDLGGLSPAPRKDC